MAGGGLPPGLQRRYELAPVAIWPGESGMRERREHQLTLLKDIFFCRIDEKKIINFNFFVFTCPVFLGVKPKITWRVCCAASSFTILVIELVLSQKISKQSNA
jgi:hypothetical protein